MRLKMAGSRVQKFRNIFQRTQGLLKAGALKTEDRPIWYDVWKAFPPKIEPKFEWDMSNEPVRKILYPEDIVRAKYYQVYGSQDVVNLGSKKIHKEEGITKAQLFVDTYIAHQRPGATEDEILEEVETKLRKEGRRYIPKDNTQPKASVLSEPELIQKAEFTMDKD